MKVLKSQFGETEENRFKANQCVRFSNAFFKRPNPHFDQRQNYCAQRYVCHGATYVRKFSRIHTTMTVFGIHEFTEQKGRRGNATGAKKTFNSSTTAKTAYSHRRRRRHVSRKPAVCRDHKRDGLGWKPRSHSPARSR